MKRRSDLGGLLYTLRKNVNKVKRLRDTKIQKLSDAFSSSKQQLAGKLKIRPALVSRPRMLMLGARFEMAHCNWLLFCNLPDLESRPNSNLVKASTNCLSRLSTINAHQYISPVRVEGLFGVDCTGKQIIFSILRD